jgi:hypothetical protein
LPQTLEEVPERPFFLKLIVEAALLAPFEDFRLGGVLMMLRTAATRSELSPRILPNSSGVGTGLPITYALIGSL